MAVPRSISSTMFLQYILLLFVLMLFPFQKTVSGRVHGAKTVMKSHHFMLEMKSLVPASTCYSPSKDEFGSLPLVHRQGPCSPLHKERREHYNSSLVSLRDQSRINSIRRRLESSFIPGPLVNRGLHLNMPLATSSEGSGEFVVTVGLGTPAQEFPLIFDTGSAVTWTWCQPCQTQSCCPQPNHCYEPSKSTTYSEAKCTLPLCKFHVHYEDNSFSTGYYVNDTLTLSPDYQIPNFIFGCAQQSTGSFDTAAGMLGLGKSDNSFIQQTEYEFAQEFCYCIPATSSSQGYLLLGLGARQKCRSNQYTRILPDPQGYFYYVRLNGITIGYHVLDFSELAPLSSISMTIIDSGTTISRLPSSVYLALRDEFKTQMSGYPLAASLSDPPLDTCYNLEGYEYVAFPSMVLNFENADVQIDQSGLVWRQSDSQVCLAFAAKKDENDLTIIGSTQQRKLSILFRAQYQRVEFGTGCGE